MYLGTVSKKVFWGFLGPNVPYLQTAKDISTNVNKKTIQRNCITLVSIDPNILDGSRKMTNAPTYFMTSHLTPRKVQQPRYSTLNPFSLMVFAHGFVPLPDTIFKMSMACRWYTFWCAHRNWQRKGSWSLSREVERSLSLERKENCFIFCE